MRGFLITATDTGVGKTVLCAALLAALESRGMRVGAYKPAVTGLEDPSELAARGRWPPDHELLAKAANMDPEDVCPLRFGPAASPVLAAELAGQRIDPERVLASARAVSEGTDALIVEGVGGLLTPLADAYTICDLAAALELPVLIAARPGLGTVNHTLLTLHAARAAGLDVRAVVLTPWPELPTTLERSNRETVARLGEVEVLGLGHVQSPDSLSLAHAGAELCGELGWSGQEPPLARAASTMAPVTVARSSSSIT